MTRQVFHIKVQFINDNQDYEQIIHIGWLDYKR